MKVIVSTASFCLLVLGFAHTIGAQVHVASSANSDSEVSGRRPDRLNGHVRRVRVETVNLVVKQGKTVEGPRAVREITTYDLKGKKIDFVAYPAENGAAARNEQRGNKQYLYDNKGNIIEMLLLGADGSILSKERFDYQFDEFGNWNQMTASVAIYENGKLGYEPFEITYRTLTYYYGEPAPKVNTAPTGTPISNTGTTATAKGPPQITKPGIDPTVSAGTTEIADVKKNNHAVEAIVVTREKSGPSDATAGRGTLNESGPQVRFVRMPEETLTKAASELQPQPSTTSPVPNGIPGELKKGQADHGVSDLKILQPGDVVDGDAGTSTALPAPATSLYDHGSALLASGQYSDAAEALRQAIKRDPNDAAAYAKLGIAYDALKQYKEAVAVFKKAIKIKPQIVDADAYYHLSNAYGALEKFSNALEAINQAIFIRRAEHANPEFANTPGSISLVDLQYSLGLALFNMRRYGAAVAELKQVIALNPKRAQAHFGLALSYLANGNRRAAEKQHDTLQSLDPVYAAKLAKLLSSNPTQQQGFGFVFRINP